MTRWIPLLCLVALFIPCDDGVPIPTLPEVRLGSFQRLTARPGIWHPLALYLTLVCASARPVRRA